MNILFLTLLDFSSIEERGIYTDLIREFINGGHNVSIVSPTEKRGPKKSSIIAGDGYEIVKQNIGKIQKSNSFVKGLNLLLLDRRMKKLVERYFKVSKFDLILYSTPPITLYQTIKYLKQRDNAKTYLMLKDIFPQNAVDLGMLRTKGIRSLIYRVFLRKEAQLYDISDYIGCMSEANVLYLKKNHPRVNTKTIEVCPNSITPETMALTYGKKMAVREHFGLPVGKTVFLFGGNLGKPQGVEFLMECIRSNQFCEDVFFLIVGSGTEFDKVDRIIRQNKIASCKIIKHLPKSDYDTLVNVCDVGLIFLNENFTIPNYPSRILSYMQASKPVLAATDPNTDIGKTIEDGEFGFWCRSGDLSKYNCYIQLLLDQDLRECLGKNGRKYLENHFTSKHTYKIIMKHFT